MKQRIMAATDRMLQTLSLTARPRTPWTPHEDLVIRKVLLGQGSMLARAGGDRFRYVRARKSENGGDYYLLRDFYREFSDVWERNQRTLAHLDDRVKLLRHEAGSAPPNPYAGALAKDWLGANESQVTHYNYTELKKCLSQLMGKPAAALCGGNPTMGALRRFHETQMRKIAAFVPSLFDFARYQGALLRKGSAPGKKEALRLPPPPPQGRYGLLQPHRGFSSPDLALRMPEQQPEGGAWWEEDEAVAAVGRPPAKSARKEWEQPGPREARGSGDGGGGGASGAAGNPALRELWRKSDEAELMRRGGGEGAARAAATAAAAAIGGISGTGDPDEDAAFNAALKLAQAKKAPVAASAGGGGAASAARPPTAGSGFNPSAAASLAAAIFEASAPPPPLRSA